MREEYYEIYRDLTDIYQFRYSDIYADYLLLRRLREDRELNVEQLRSLRLVTNAIENVVSEMSLTRRIRPDAKHFLEINLHQMVILPTSHPNAPSEVNIQQTDLEGDIRRILQNAVSFSNGNEEISGHKVLQAIERVWGELYLNSLNIWAELT